jgi:hypothetical protein
MFPTAQNDTAPHRHGRRKLTPAERAQRRERSLAPYKDAVARRALRATLPAIDERQIYPVLLALVYLDESRKSFYQRVKRAEIAISKRGRRSFVSGSELVRLSQVPSAAA